MADDACPFSKWAQRHLSDVLAEFQASGVARRPGLPAQGVDQGSECIPLCTGWIDQMPGFN